MKLEQRAVLELRAKDRRLEGYAAKFNTEARIADFIEMIAPGAFSASLKSGRDVLAMVDHDPGKVLARTRSGNLKLAEDHAAAFELSVPDTQPAAMLSLLLSAATWAECPSAFSCPGRRGLGGNRRTLSAIDLYEISVVPRGRPTKGTSVNARARAPRLALARRYLETVLMGC